MTMNDLLSNLNGLLLALMIVIHIWIIITLYHQNVPSVFIPLYIYFTLLLVIIEVCALFFLRGVPDYKSEHVIKIQLIAIAFIPPLLYYMCQNYLVGSNFPSFNIKNFAFFITSLVISGLALSGLISDGIIKQHGIVITLYTKYFWIYPIYFYITFGFIINLLLRKYQSEKRKPELERLKILLRLIIPAAILFFSLLVLLPIWDIQHPAILFNYIFLGFTVVFVAFKFQIIEFDENVLRSLYFFEISGLLFILAAIFFKEVRTEIFFLLIPLLLLLLFTFQNLQIFIHESIGSRPADPDFDLEDELEVLIDETDKYIDKQALSQFIGDLSLKVLHCTKCTVITSRFDVRPYQIIYIDGFPKAEIEGLLSRTNSPFIETMEYNRQIINKFELSPQSELYQMMETYHIYLGIPLVSENNLLGFILLGGERKVMRITKKDLKFAKFLSLRAAHAFQNIDKIQEVVQSQKMADLGLVASQLAHDFQSFITLVKLQSSEDEKLRQHANYMEKLVRDLLNYTRPKELQLRAVNINQLIDMTLDLLNIPTEIVIEKHYSDSIPQINVDADQMRRALLNLFENSIIAVKDKPARIKITTRPLRPLTNYRRNTWLYLEILDDGSGIPEEFLDKIFEPFFTTRKQQGGNGMGLAIVKQIISRHKGFIDVTSKEGKGTIFNIRLPYLR
jgi:signal transduction histidine kinase